MSVNHLTDVRCPNLTMLAAVAAEPFTRIVLSLCPA
jgi:hypothetical protein